MLAAVLIWLLTMPVAAAGIAAPVVPEAGRDVMPGNTDSFGDALWELIQIGIKQIHPELEALRKTEAIDKVTFGSSELPEKLAELNEKDTIESITFVGLCTDICVISNVMVTKAFFPEIPVIVDAACCAGVSPETHKNALEAMKVCQVKVENE